MKVKNMVSSNGNKVANQFIINDATVKHVSPNGTENFYTGAMFQSYDSNIALKLCTGEILLDEFYWDYSKTTGKYRNQFLNETKKETQTKIDSGKYKLIDLNT